MAQLEENVKYWQQKKEAHHLAASRNWVLFVGVLVIRANLFGLCIGVSDHQSDVQARITPGMFSLCEEGAGFEKCFEACRAVMAK